MAINPNNMHKPEHRLLVGATGARKTSYIKQQEKNYKYRIKWDPESDHTGHRYKSIPAFGRALLKAVKSGKPFNIALTVDPTKENYELFCELVWEIADGRRKTLIVVEEKSDVAWSIAKTGKYDGYIQRKGRKYWLHVWTVTQAPTEIDKTTWKQAIYKWCGFIEDDLTVNKMKGVMRVPIDKLTTMEQGEYYLKIGGIRDPQHGKVTFN